MNQQLVRIIFVIWFFQLTGCASSSSPEAGELRIGGPSRPDSITLELQQKHTPDMPYHSQDELESVFKRKLVNLLHEKKLFSNSGAAHGLIVDVLYIRKFVGEDTPLPTDSLGYPMLGYTIKVLDEHENTIKDISKGNQTYSDNFFMNLQTIARGLRDKKYELKFIDALANKITQQIESL